MRPYSNILLTLIAGMVISCQPKTENKVSANEHITEVETWYQDRLSSLKSEEGWLNLIGLYWLEDGDNSFGSGANSQLLLETDGFPEKIGVFTLENEKVYFTPKVDGVILGENEVKEKIQVFDAASQKSEILAFKSLRWNIIKRADAYGVRLRDLQADAVTQFNGIERYPVDLDWRIEGRFVTYNPVREIPITNVLGQTIANPSPGFVEFEKDGTTFKIEALDAGEELYLIIADNTSGGETYGGGRYMYVKKPITGDLVILDFNMAYNPPCVFTAHATCPLPPRQNILDLDITAGEKNFGDH